MVLILSISTAAYANSIDALERERANTINLILDKTISITERNDKLEKIKMKLLDMERMIINNKNIFNLTESKKEEMLTAVKKNLNLMKENPLKSLLKEIIS